MATSYANTGGTGDRSAIITVTSDKTIGGGALVDLINGSTANSLYVTTELVVGKYIRFDFGVPKVIDEATFYISNNNNQGIWKWQGSINGSSWTDIGGTFTLGGSSPQVLTTLNGNSSGYRYYRLLGVSSYSDQTPYWQEIEFKIDDFLGYEYIGQIPLTLTPQAENYGPHAYVGQIPLTFTPQSTCGGPHSYLGNLLLRFIPTAEFEPVGAGSSTAIPTSTGGWAMGGAGVWGGSSTPTSTNLSEFADVEPTGFYLGGGAEPGEPEVISTIPAADEITAEVAFKFCGAGATGEAATAFPASEVIEAAAGFALGGKGVWGQVAPEDIPSTVLVGSGGFILSGSGFSLDPGVTPTATVIVPTGGWVLGGVRPDSVEVTYPGSLDRVIESKVAFEMGGEGVWGGSLSPSATVIVSDGAIFVLGGACLATSRMPPIAVITGDATGGFVLGGTGFAVDGVEPAEIYEAWVLSGNAFEPSVFSNFRFNSFATKDGQAYGANENGIYLLGGDHDAGESIQSGARVGPVNFSSAGTKRIRGVVFGNGGSSTRVRVRTDEAEGVFAPDRDTDRVTVSRDLQASEFTVDILNFDELSHLEIFPLRLARR